MAIGYHPVGAGDRVKSRRQREVDGCEYCCIVVQQCIIVIPMNTEELRARARVMKALASPVRLKIVDELRRGERCVCELQPLFPMNKSTLSRHVAELKNAGIVGERRQGVRCFLRLRTPCVLKMFDCTMGVIRAEARRQSELVSRRNAKP